MNISLLDLNNKDYIEIDNDLDIPKEYLENTQVRDIKNTHVTGTIRVDSVDDLLLDIEVTGTFILGCAVTLEDVPYNFSTKIEENVGQIDNFFNNRKNYLDILPIIWENIVLEVPIRVVKEGVKDINLHGNGWELVSNEDE